MQLIQLLLPLRDNAGNPFPKEYYQPIRQELTQRFDGLTVFSRAPAEGLWKDDEVEVKKDDIVIFEVMSERDEEEWWGHYKRLLEKKFAQDEIVIRIQHVTLVK